MPEGGGPPRVVLVAKRSSYARFVEEERDPRARELLARRDPSVARWRASHREHARTLAATERALQRLGARVLKVQRAHAAFDTADARLVVVVGGDGTLLAASHQVGASVPVLGVNSSPSTSVGFFSSTDWRGVAAALEEALYGRPKALVLQRMAVSVNGRTRWRRVLNEALFCHASPAATSRYILRYGEQSEEQRSSGLFVGPAAGSTAAQRSAGGRVLPLTSARLQLVVREPYTPDGQRYALRRLEVLPGTSLSVINKMQEGRLFLDGPIATAPVNLGDHITFHLSPEPLTVLGLSAQRAR